MDYMNRVLVIFCIVFANCFSAFFAQAQIATIDRGTGVRIDKTKYANVPLATPLTNKSYNSLPFAHSLKKFCPVPGDQLNTGTCVGWSAAYGAQTIINSIINQWENEQSGMAVMINSEAFSPSFIYQQVLTYEGLDQDCYLGIHIADALNLMKKAGNLKIEEYPFDANCIFSPDNQQIHKAVQYCIKDFQRLTFTDGDEAKVNKVRQSIASNMPVIIGMEILDNFKQVKHENNTWNPAEGDPNKGSIHAMLVVGYDDMSQQFEIMNSWGEEWANRGFIYINYEDFNTYVKEAYHILYDVPTNVNMADMAAIIEFKELATQMEEQEMACTNEIIATMRATQSSAVYTLDQQTIPNTAYQVWLTTKTNNTFVYAFSFDYFGQIDVLYPFSDDIMSLYETDNYDNAVASIIPYKDGTVALPHEQFCMQLDRMPGTYNCFLFAQQPLNINQIVQQIQTSSGSLYDRLHSVLASKLASPKDVIYDSGEIGFSASIDKSMVVPIIVDMNHVSK